MRNYISSSDPVIPSWLLLGLLCIYLCISCVDETNRYDVVVLGGGTGAVAAGIQSSRSGAKTLHVNPYPWLGGMLTSAGVSATDGNHQLGAGLWGEFRQLLREHYGGIDALFTGWVSNTMFEPSVGAKYWDILAQNEENLLVQKNTTWKLLQKSRYWEIEITDSLGITQLIEAKVLIDGTDLGDVAAKAGVEFDVGMDARAFSGESMAPTQGNDIVQDLTYVAILKDYGPDADKTIPIPPDYDTAEFYCTCQHPKCTLLDVLECEKMMTYGKLPNDKYMINWPKHGNDFYVNMVELDPDFREKAVQKAKAKTLRYIYYIQHELGFKHLGLAEDEFPTPDLLPFYPYHREGRRIIGEVRMDIAHITHPFHDELYRTGIAVGDYPIDHHHAEFPEAPEINFPDVPSYSVAMGTLIPKEMENLIIADKAISVTNIVNGTTRLQPVVIQIGQAAGLMAAMAALRDVELNELDPRTIQQNVLNYGGYLLPYIDVTPDDPHFMAIQRMGATGVLRGTGVPYQWANQTWFYPDSLVNGEEIGRNLKSYDPTFSIELKREVAVQDAIHLSFKLLNHFKMNSRNLELPEFQEEVEQNWEQVFQLANFNRNRGITRREMAVLLDHVNALFQTQKINFYGHWK